MCKTMGFLSALVERLGRKCLSAFSPSQDCRFVAVGCDGALYILHADIGEAVLTLPMNSVLVTGVGLGSGSGLQRCF